MALVRVGAVLERWQVPVYLAAMMVGLVLGRIAPGAGAGFEHAVNPLLAALLFVTFRQVPAAELMRSLRAGRFVGAVLVVNFVVVPAVVAAMLPLLPGDRALRLGVLLVLLCPCVDWVVVFGGLAGARRAQLLAVTPLLLVAQMVLLPGYLVVFLGSGLADVVQVGPFLRAFGLLIVLPLALAWAAQAWAAQAWAAPGRRGRLAGAAVMADLAMVPLLAATLIAVVASQVPRVRANVGALARVAPCYVLFLVVMALAGVALSRLFRLDVPAARGVLFSGAARNSLVVLPLALALPGAERALAAAAVVTQTLVEILGMVAYVRVVPRLLPTAPARRPSR
ncbi:arsenite transporter [Frankia sp. AiPs1]|uniref:bile acid:sodium symporter n=1 Tax=Frankia sp. AiPa1 TaxID=573492 RepID=UPI00202B3B1F|nr:bile acid:sodium symporter [Frankia sp. AiPa1]MCL9761690.1 bile acid:sodium symporter [Frankia sp. AiPa1]